MPPGGDVRFWSWDDYMIEDLWDYGFIEVSTDGGTTWAQLEVRDEAGNVVSTDEDPNGRLRPTTATSRTASPATPAAIGTTGST